ncbi:MAG: hypothetical protein RJA44_63 [Pseudomonadota bacterium]
MPAFCTHEARPARSTLGHRGRVDGPSGKPAMTLAAARSLPFRRCLLAALLLCACMCAQAQFALIPTPLTPQQPPVSAAADDAAYRLDAARHLYRSYPMQIWRGKLPPLLYAVAVVATSVDAEGRISAIEVTREPAYAKEVVPWILGLIRRAAPLPKPETSGGATYVDIWLVDEGGKFQLDSLTEGQRDR